MEKSEISKRLTFDLFGTILDLGGSLRPYIADFLQAKDAPISSDRFWGPMAGTTTHRTIPRHPRHAGA